MRPFYRLSGGGNDFLALVEPAAEPVADEIRALCRRGLSVGADGLFILERSANRVRMRYFNPDGKPADLCLNGTRCAARLACHLGWAEKSLGIETGVGTLQGRLVDTDSVALDLPRPPTPRRLTLEVGTQSFSGWQAEVGVPHFVLPWPTSLAAAPVTELGAALRCHQVFGEQGSNVDFVRFPGRHRIEVRTFERGVEAETLACGTGVMAATAAGLAESSLELPIRALTCGGFELRVEAAAAEGRQDIWALIGDARLIAEGTLLSGATDLPPSPHWT